MIASDCTATVPAVPLVARFVVRLPGASAPKIACVRFDSWLIGPQFVSPSTRSPTSISGPDSSTATTVSHHDTSKNAYWTMIIPTVETPMPIPTHDSGNSDEPIDFDDIALNDRDSVRHLRASDVRPAAISIPVPGH